MDILFQNYSLLDPLIPIAALISVAKTRKFTHIWPLTLLSAAVVPFIVILLACIERGSISFLWSDILLQEQLQQMLILRLVVASFWALLFWWSANRLRDHIKQ